MAADASCPLCTGPGGLPIGASGGWRVVRVEDDAFPAYYRVICASHATTFEALPSAVRDHGMAIVFNLERILNARLQPARVNIASLGNMVPHLHWHVTARFDWDSHFPQAIWAPAQRTLEVPARDRLPVALEVLDLAVQESLAAQGIAAH